MNEFRCGTAPSPRMLLFVRLFALGFCFKTCRLRELFDFTVGVVSGRQVKLDHEEICVRAARSLASDLPKTTATRFRKAHLVLNYGCFS